MSANLTKGDPEELAGVLDPNVRKAIENARAKIKNRAHMQANVLKGDLSLILDDFCATHGLREIEWPPPNDSVPPSFVLDSLCAKLADRMAENEFARFLENFTAGLIDLDEAEQRRNQ